MRKEQITNKEAICLLFLFITGSTLIMGIGGDAKNDAWIAGITGILMAIPIILIYARLVTIFPGKDLYEMLELSFGKIVGKIISIVYTWYAFHLGALVLRNFGEFINTVTLPETPIFVPMMCLGILCIAAAKSGIEVMGRTGAYFIPIFVIIIVVVQLLGIPKLRFENIRPILSNGIQPIIKGGFAAFSFPFAETVLFLGLLFSLKSSKASYKVYFSGLFLAGGLIITLTMRNIMVLGGMVSKLYFPSHVAVSRISIGDFLQRIEVTVAIVFVIGAFIKASICLLVACKGVGRIFNLKDYRSIVIQTGLLMIYLSHIIYDSIMEMRYFAFKVYEYYAFPFQVIIPIMLLIIAEIKMRLNKDSSTNKHLPTKPSSTENS